ncbi:YhjD/YihY/BrkB family envelope integrity protein [Mycoplasmopsis cricetuli]|uniref:YhjD/YihY/BrkB family envelope integrity protein n=1 Tax=Mycoplasmopsis cricetuli TaxID=171283 RepID=UPI00047275CC|nr:YhjD/YihY/BrkB family envelope integrity protein [Mycoplasmopsis cricetuli]
MLNLDNNIKWNKITYKKLLWLRYRRWRYRYWSVNLIWDDPLKYLGLWSNFILKSIITLFCWFLTFSFSRSYKWLISENKNKEIFHKYNKKRQAVVEIVFQKFRTNEFNFTWLTIAFYFLISFVPIIFIVSNLHFLVGYAYFGPESEEKSILNNWFISGTLNNFLPDIKQYANSISLVEFDNSTSNFLVFFRRFFIFIATLWFASTGYGKLVSAVNYMYDHEKSGTYLGNRLKGLGLVLLVSVLFWLFSLGYTLINYLFLEYNEFLKVSVTTFSKAIFGIFVFVFLYFLFLFLFKLCPSFTIKFRHINRGILFAAIPNAIFVIIFSLWIGDFLNYDKYGSIGFVLTLAFFITWFVNLMFLGILFNQAYYKSFHNQRTYNRGSSIYYLY